MKTIEEPTELVHLNRLNEYGPDDLFICSASFEERSISITQKMGADFRTRYAVIFVVEEPHYKKQIDSNLLQLQGSLSKKTGEGIFTISCQRENPIDAITQLKNIWHRCKPRSTDEPYITIDISGFTKIYLLELLHYLVIEASLGIPRVIHTVQTYLPTKLTRGVQQITTVPNFFGSAQLDRQTLLILLLGFEPERSLAVWQHYNPARTIALITNPPRYGNEDYLKYAQDNNSQLLSQPSVELKEVPPDNPYAIKNMLEEINSEAKGSYNMVIGPFGTKSQTVGVFLFCLEYPKTQVVYSFPVNYTRSYLQRKPGPTFVLPLSPAART